MGSQGNFFIVWIIFLCSLLIEKGNYSYMTQFIPQSLLTALLYRRPEDPIEYMEKCMQKAKQSQSLEWDSFLEINSQDKGKPDVTDPRLKTDVQNAYGQIFKTEQQDMTK